jgi:DNA-binding MarR family transcriptional regulator
MAIRELYDKPGYRIRRLRQISAAIFSAEAAAFDITAQQWTMLQGVGEFPSAEQNVLSDALQLDRATTAAVLARLEEKGLVRRKQSTLDRRRKHVELTARGRRLIAAMEPVVARVQHLILEPLAPDDRAAFNRMLEALVDAHGSSLAELTEKGEEAS